LLYNLKENGMVYENKLLLNIWIKRKEGRKGRRERERERERERGREGERISSYWF
jgi:hypothetical protein